MTSTEFKNIVKKFNLADPKSSDQELEYVYKTWSVKTFCTVINSKHLTFTRDNDLHLYSMATDEFMELLNMNIELLKHYKCEQKLIKMNDDFI